MVRRLNRLSRGGGKSPETKNQPDSSKKSQPKPPRCRRLERFSPLENIAPNSRQRKASSLGRPPDGIQRQANGKQGRRPKIHRRFLDLLFPRQRRLLPLRLSPDKRGNETRMAGRPLRNPLASPVESGFGPSTHPRRIPLPRRLTKRRIVLAVSEEKQ